MHNDAGLKTYKAPEVTSLDGYRTTTQQYKALWRTVYKDAGLKTYKAPEVTSLDGYPTTSQQYMVLWRTVNNNDASLKT